MQSYNDSRTGIWPQEDSYGPGTPYTNVTDMDYDIGILSLMTQPLPQVADAEAAAPFGAQSYSFNDAPLLYGGLGAERTLETVARPFTRPSTRQYSVPCHIYPSTHGRSGVSTMIDNTMDLGVLSAQQPMEVEHHIHPLGIDQSSFSNPAPDTTLDNLRLATGSIELMTSPAPAPSPSTSGAKSSSIVEKCPYRGCRAKFTGSSWKDSLRRHRSNEHDENKEKPICPVCHTVFQSGRGDNMKRHIISKHPEHQLPASRKLRSRRSGPRRRRL